MPRRRARPRRGDAGFTLVEVLVALAIFALIGAAGFSMLDQVLRTQRLTEGRLEQLAAMQRAMHLITMDFAQARGASLMAAGGPDPAAVALRRSAPEAQAGSVALRYVLQDGVLLREVVAQPGAAPARQPLLGGVAAAGWRFYDADAGWGAQWPPAGRMVMAGQPPANPLAVELTITLATDGTLLRRVALLPQGAR